MFEHGVRMRYRTDCGVAALATATGKSWPRCKRETGPHMGRECGVYYGIACEAMRLGICTLTGKDTYSSGASLLDAKGSRGVVLCRVETDDDCADTTLMHWLAWERDAEGVVWCFNPWNGETFRAASMTGRGFYALCHFTVG